MSPSHEVRDDDNSNHVAAERPSELVEVAAMFPPKDWPGVTEMRFAGNNHRGFPFVKKVLYVMLVRRDRDQLPDELREALPEDAYEH